MYQRILVPLDGSALAEAALTHLPHLVGPETEVLLLRVTAPPPETVAMAPSSMAPMPPTPVPLSGAAGAADAATKAVQDAEAYLRAQAARLRGLGGRPRTLVLADDDAARAIAEQAQAAPADLIVMATHGRSGVVRWVLGSVADQVLHATPTPLLLVRPAPPTA